jgi:hypothetical protein
MVIKITSGRWEKLDLVDLAQRFIMTEAEITAVLKETIIVMSMVTVTGIWRFGTLSLCNIIEKQMVL